METNLVFNININTTTGFANKTCYIMLAICGTTLSLLLKQENELIFFTSTIWKFCVEFVPFSLHFALDEGLR